MVYNIMFGLGKEAPVEYTTKYYKELSTEMENIVQASISSDILNIDIENHKTLLKTNKSTVKTDGKTTIKLNLIPNGSNN